MRLSQPPPTGPARMLGMVFGIVFAGIGLTVIGFLWSERGFGEPPLFFKLFGSLIAIAFVAVGATFFMTSLKGQLPNSENAGAARLDTATGDGAGYKCPACGARLGEAADVSPKGDVKCGYCKQWFNIHG